MILKAASTLVTAKEFAEGSGATRSLFDLLVEGGVLTPCLPSFREAGIKTIWDADDCVRFLVSIFLDASPLRQSKREKLDHALHWVDYARGDRYGEDGGAVHVSALGLV